MTKGRQFFYDEEGKKVWERNLDIYGRVKTEEALGEKNLIPFRFRDSMRMKRRDCIIIVSGIIRQRKDVIRSRIRLDWQVVIQLCMDMFIIDLVNPNSSLHVGWNNVHSEYNQYISQELGKISRLAKENNWEKRKIQKEIRMLQSEVKKDLKKGVIKCH